MPADPPSEFDPGSALPEPMENLGVRLRDGRTTAAIWTGKLWWGDGGKSFDVVAWWRINSIQMMTQ